jgi:hypothetical protein
VRDDSYRLAVIDRRRGDAALFTEQEANERAFTALTRFLDLLDDAPGLSAGVGTSLPSRPARARSSSLPIVRIPSARGQLRRCG